MADREGQDRGRPGEMERGGISPVIGDLDRTPPLPRPGPGGEGIAGTVQQSLRRLRYPLARDDMVREAAGQGVQGGVLDLLVHLPNRVYASAEDVAAELGRSR